LIKTDSKKLIFLVLLVALVVRIITFAKIGYVFTLDTKDYIDLANNILKFDFSNFNGMRTPGYSILFIISGMNNYIVVALQILMGLAITFLIYKIMMLLTERVFISIIAAGIYGFFIPFVYYEFTLYTEIMTTFFITFSFYLFIKYLFIEKSRNLALCLAIGLMLAAVAITRPIYIILPIIYFIFMIFHLFKPKVEFSRIIKIGLLIIVPTVLLLGGWSFVNLKVNKTLAISTGRGFGLVELMEEDFSKAKVSKEDQVLMDIYNKARQKKIDSGLPYINVIWGCPKIMEKATGLTYSQLSDRIGGICINVIKEKPLVYLKAVVTSQLSFWRAPGLLNTDNSVPAVIKYTNLAQRIFLIFMEITFLLIPFIYLFLKRKRQFVLPNQIKIINIMVFLAIFGVCISMSFIEFGEGRFALPTFPMLICVVLNFYYSAFIRSDSV